MKRFAPTLAVLLAGAALLALPASAEAVFPWWALEAGSRPTNLQPAPTDTEVQEARTTANSGAFAARVEVAGEVLGCLGTGELSSTKQSADQLCEILTGGLFTASQTAPEFEAMLQAAYGAGEVEVTGGPVGGERFLITTPGRWVSPVRLTPFSLGPLTAGKAFVTPVSEGSGRLVITATNVGNAPLNATSDPLTISEELPPGVSAYGAESFAGVGGKLGPVDCTLATTHHLACSFEGELPPYEAIEVELAVALAPKALDGASGEVTVSGGDAEPKSATQTLRVSGEAVRFGVEDFSMRAEEEGGAAASQAGSHPFQLTQSLRFNAGQVHFTASGKRADAYVDQPGQVRNVDVKLPPGLVGNPSPIPTCSFQQFTTQGENTPSLINECPSETAVGAASVTVIEPGVLKFARVAVPIFNLEPAYGEPARFGFMVVGVPVTIDTELRGGEAYAIGAKVLDASQLPEVLASTVSIWGNPGDPAHDSSRGWGCLYFAHPFPCERSPSQSEAAFLRMPVQCADPLHYGIEVEPWNVPLGTEVASATDESPALTGCDLLPFNPAIESTPTTKLASNPSGLDFTLRMPNDGLENPRGRAEAQAEKIEVSLPPGMTANPSLAESLATCSEGELRRETASSQPGEGCPEASKIGTVELETPLLEGRLLKGSVFVATPYENPAGSLVALYLTIREPKAGVLVTQSLQVKPDPASGQLVSVAEDIPQLPFSELRLHLREGGRAPLISAPRCGTVQTRATFHPYSVSSPVVRTSDSKVDHGPDGGACPSGPSPFHPGFEAGSLSAQAGAYTPFQMRLTRNDGEQDMGRFSFKLPPGVVPRLAGIPYCSEAAIAQAKSRQGPHGGEEEKDSPSCPAASQIGRTVAGAGVGNQLTYVPGKLYLAGPYHGDPISAVSITPAVAGPFDAGTVVVREALRLNPVTHVGEVDGSASDPIPHILKGIPLNLREVQIYADKPEFTLDPTSCERFEARSTIWGDGTALEPLGESPVDLSSPYQAVNCAKLGFKPELDLKLKGGTRRGAFPALRAAYVPRKHNQANLARLALTFPHSEFIEQGHFRTICTRVQFAAGPGFGARCPKGSIYGHVKAWTPLLDEPLSGPVYLRSSNHNLPDAVLALHGLVDIEVATRIDSVHGRLRAIVADVPDAPVSRAVVRMQGGQKGLFVNSRDLCHKAKRNRARVDAKGQNNRRRLFKPLLRAPGCGKAKRHRSHRHRRHKG